MEPLQTSIQNDSAGFTLTILGCGTLGTAILSGIFSALSDFDINSSQASCPSSTSTVADEMPPKLPSRFIACVTKKESAERIERELGSFGFELQVLVNDNLKGVEEADVIILGCKPQLFREVLGCEGVRDRLEGKLVLSILAGVSVQQLEDTIYGHESSRKIKVERRCRIVRVMPNTAASVRESMTVIANSSPPLHPRQSSLVSWIFNQVGKVINLPPQCLDASTALCGSGPAFMALILEAIADGAVAMGIPRAEAQLMAAQTMRGTSGMVLDGEHPALIRDKVSTPGGCTIGGLLVLEEGRVRGTVARAVREATVVAGQLGKGVQGVNGTRLI